MVFSSSIFLCFFLPLVLFCSLIIKTKYVNVCLLLFSLLFYMWGEPKFIIVFLASILMNYCIGLLLGATKEQPGKKKAVMVMGVFLNLFLLFIYKYLGLIINTFDLQGFFPESFSNIALPIGISFYTFQAMSYLIDVYRDQVKVQKNLLKLAPYIALFPQLIAGPIVRYIDVANEIDNRTVSVSDFRVGIRRFTVGLAKKVLISNSVALYADTVFGMSADLLTSGAAWLGIICYTIQIYFDFSGYSDMAIGIGRMLGFHFLENFKMPYASKSIQEFWRRWHISLSSWFRDYLYIPLGGNRKGLFRMMINQLIVFGLCGIWHGAEWSFLVWGIYHGLFLLLEKIPKVKYYLNKLPPIIGVLYTMLVVMVGWVFFRADTISHAGMYLRTMFSFNGFDLFGDRVSLSLTLSTCIIGIVMSTVKMPIRYEENDSNTRGIIFQDILLILLLLLCLIRIVPNNYNPFIYFRF